MQLIGLMWLAALVAGGALVLLASGLGRVAARADENADRQAALLLEERAARRAAIDQVRLPPEVAEAMAARRPRFVREDVPAQTEAVPLDGALLAHRLHHR